jgi:hypothetical protein
MNLYDIFINISEHRLHEYVANKNPETKLTEKSFSQVGVAWFRLVLYQNATHCILHAQLTPLIAKIHVKTLPPDELKGSP